jgi:hypothetical protein
MVVCAQPAFSGEPANNDATDMEIIEMLGELEDDTDDLELAMSDEDWDEPSTTQEVKNAK